MESMPSMSRLMKIIHVEEGSQREKKKEISNKHDNSLSCFHISSISLIRFYEGEPANSFLLRLKTVP